MRRVRTQISAELFGPVQVAVEHSDLSHRTFHSSPVFHMGCICAIFTVELSHATFWHFLYL